MDERRVQRIASIFDFETPLNLGVGVWLPTLFHAFFVTQISIFPHTLDASLLRGLFLDDVFSRLTSDAVVSNLAPSLLLGAVLLICCWKIQPQHGRDFRLNSFTVLFPVATFLFCHAVDALLARITSTQILHEIRGFEGNWEVQPLYLLIDIVPFLLFAVTVVSVHFSLSRERFATPVRGIVILWRRAEGWVFLSLAAGALYFLLRMAVAVAGTATQTFGIPLEGLVVVLVMVTVLHAYLYLVFISSVLKVAAAVTRD